MSTAVVLENIEEMRRLRGIEDIELRQTIRQLVVGDRVWLTFLSGVGEFKGETLQVRITSMQGYKFRGKLTSKPPATAPPGLHIGTPVTFDSSHIHSLAQVGQEQD